MTCNISRVATPQQLDGQVQLVLDPNLAFLCVSKCTRIATSPSRTLTLVTKRFAMNFSNLSIDECQLIAAKLELDPQTLGMFAMTCRLARDSVQLVQKGCKLDSISRHMNQGELCNAFQLTPDEAKRLPYHEDHRVSNKGL